MNGIREEAARWFTRMRNAAIDHPERGRFEAWLASDPLHAREYAAFEAFWQRLDTPQGWETVDRGLERRREQRRRLLKRGLGGMLLAVVVGKAAHWQWLGVPVWQLARQTGTGGILRESLADGSRLTLGAASEAVVTYTRSERKVFIHRGEAAFDVIRDPERPFVVEAGGATVIVLGTRFAVSLLADRTRISVDHGRVRVETGPFWRRRFVLLEEGEVAELAVPREEASQDALTWEPWEPLAKVRRDAAGAFAFEQGFIDLQGAGLAEIAETFSRYRNAPVRAAPGHGGNEPRITASVNVADAESFLYLLPRMAAVEVRQGTDDAILLEVR